MKPKVAYSDSFTLGIVFDSQVVAKLMELCSLYEVEPYELLVEAIDTMYRSMGSTS